ncbi:MAG: hypothetical protein CMK89_18105 [Pseudomonadales bacterium]|nr:hypothetical protein [Pseudomonadales bacterium]
MIRLSTEAPFAHGGNRLCFVDPGNQDRCIKVRRPEFTLADLRKKKGFPYTLLPLSAVDESRKEDKILRACERRLGDDLYAVVSRHYGFVDTDMGPGLCSELIRSADGRISLSVMEYVWEFGKTESLLKALDRFADLWPEMMVPSRDLLLHNVVAQCDADNEVERLVVIDGLGYSGMIPFSWLSSSYKIRRANKKLQKFRQLLDELLDVQKKGEMTNLFWKQKHDGKAHHEADNP